MAQLRVVVVGHDVHIVGLRLFHVIVLHNRYQICPVLKEEEEEREELIHL